MRRFYLQRDVDVSGVSGTGVVARGVCYQDGHCTLRWMIGPVHSTVIYNSIDDLIAVHGHQGSTKLEWIDGEDEHV